MICIIIRQNKNKQASSTTHCN